MPRIENGIGCDLVLQVSDLLKQQQANLTLQENILEGQVLAQQQAEAASQESQRELKEMIETLAKRLDEKSKKQMELNHQYLNLQEALKRMDNFSGTGCGVCEEMQQQAFCSV